MKATWNEEVSRRASTLRFPSSTDFKSTFFDYVGKGIVLIEEPAEVFRCASAEWERVLDSYGEVLRAESPAEPAMLLLSPEELSSRLTERSEFPRNGHRGEPPNEDVESAKGSIYRVSSYRCFVGISRISSTRSAGKKARSDKFIFSLATAVSPND